MLCRVKAVEADTARLVGAAPQDQRGIYKPGFYFKECWALFLDLRLAQRELGSQFLRLDLAERVHPIVCVDQLNSRYGRCCVLFAYSSQDRT